MRGVGIGKLKRATREHSLDKPWDARPSATASWPVTGTTYAEEHAWWWNEYDELIEEMKRKAGSGWEEVDAWVAH